MSFCPNCGTQTAGAFCPNCGAAVGGANPGAAPGSGYVPPGSPSSVQTPGLTENVASALCYLFGLVTGIIFLLLAPYNQNKTVRFHAFQAIFTHVALIILSILLVIITHGFGVALFPLLSLLGLLLWLYMMYSAYNNRKVKLPLVGDLAEKQA